MSELYQDFNQVGRQIEVLIVTVADELVAVPLESVKEVIEYTKVTTVPMCPEVIRGVINVRGSVVPVVDAASRLGFGTTKLYDKYSCIVIYETLNRKTGDLITIGLMVSRVRAIETFELKALYDKPAFGAHIDTKFVWRMANYENTNIPILVMSNLFEINELNNQMLSFQSASLAKWDSHGM